MNKILIICGPTATGKTDLGIKLAKEFKGEIISADSRQVYQGMDIGTGKDIDKNSEFRIQNLELTKKNKKLNIGYREKDRIPIWLVDICKSDYRFNVGEYAKLARIVIADIQSRNKLPIVVGGTGLYIKALVEPLSYVLIPPNSQLRKKLEQISAEELQKELIKLNREKFTSMNNSDQNNPRRLIRAIEMAEWNIHKEKYKANNILIDRNKELNFLLIGLTLSWEELFARIDQRVEKRVKQGIIDEIKGLLKKGYSWDLPAMSTLGYREWKPYFIKSKIKNQKLKINKEELIKNIIDDWKLHERQYAKRQITWFKKQAGIEWYDITKPDHIIRILEKVKLWYDRK